jgi:hypothetical protein
LPPPLGMGIMKIELSMKFYEGNEQYPAYVSW